tara:strand:- start:12 stop:449 length:438 start_codon:yes stop_codon:yes gene_type:complete
MMDCSVVNISINHARLVKEYVIMQGMWAPSLLGILALIFVFMGKELFDTYLVKRRKMLYALLAYKYAIDNPNVIVSTTYYIGGFSLEYNKNGKNFIEFHPSSIKVEKAANDLPADCNDVVTRKRSLEKIGINEPLLYLAQREFKA